MKWSTSIKHTDDAKLMADVTQRRHMQTGKQTRQIRKRRKAAQISRGGIEARKSLCERVTNSCWNRGDSGNGLNAETSSMRTLFGTEGCAA